MDLYTNNALTCSELTTKKYSTSFSIGVRLLSSEFRNAIYAIYGYVRFADEIVDTFFDFPQKELLENFRKNTYDAIEKRISTNPILHSFQWAFHKYAIDIELVNAFLDSMEMDLYKQVYNEEEFKRYVYGSAEVDKLMCLKVFVNKDNALYDSLVHPARKLGEAFQKVNFLRDIKDDFQNRSRLYFPGTDFKKFTREAKRSIERDIQEDFDQAFLGILLLPKGARFGVYVAYSYYLKLFKKIKKTNHENILQKRYRISDFRKLIIIPESKLRNVFFGKRIVKSKRELANQIEKNKRKSKEHQQLNLVG